MASSSETDFCPPDCVDAPSDAIDDQVIDSASHSAHRRLSLAMQIRFTPALRRSPVFTRFQLSGEALTTCFCFCRYAAYTTRRLPHYFIGLDWAHLPKVRGSLHDLMPRTT